MIHTRCLPGITSPKVEAEVEGIEAPEDEADVEGMDAPDTASPEVDDDRNLKTRPRLDIPGSLDMVKLDVGKGESVRSTVASKTLS